MHLIYFESDVVIHGHSPFLSLKTLSTELINEQQTANRSGERSKMKILNAFIVLIAAIALTGCSPDSLVGSQSDDDFVMVTGDSHNVTGDSHNVTGDSHNVTGDSHNVTGDSHNVTGDSHN